MTHVDILREAWVADGGSVESMEKPLRAMAVLLPYLWEEVPPEEVEERRHRARAIVAIMHTLPLEQVVAENKVMLAELAAEAREKQANN
jgi:hypothetical protein